jgi:hypothetical protein
MAIQAAIDPKVLDGSGGPIFLRDENTGMSTQEVSMDQIRRACLRFRTEVALLLDLDQGRVVMSMEEYRQQPAAFVEARRIFSDTKARLQSSREELS